MKRKRKVALKDYSRDNLPSNRVEVFFDVLRNRWKTIFGLGILLLLFMIPLLTADIIEEVLSVQLLGMQQEGKIDGETLSTYLRTTYFIMGMVKILMLMILSIGISGSVCIIKRLIWAEGIQFFHDFTKGIRENWKKMLHLFLLMGVVITILKVAPHMLSGMSELTGTSYTILRSVITAISVLLLMPLGAFVFSQIVYYENRISIMIVNSIAFFGKTWIYTYGLLAAICVPYAMIIRLCNISTKIVVNSLAIVILLPLIIMIWLLYSCFVFDKYINPTFYPEIVDKGIWRNVDKGKKR